MMIRRLVIYSAILLMGCVLGANVYNTAVDAPNWGSAIPQSLEAAKNYFAVANPGTFFRVHSPAAQIAALAVLIATWPFGRRIRILAAAALVLAVLADAMTFTYFYPRNEIMFGSDSHPADVLRNAWSGWSAMNHVRTAVVFVAVVCELVVLSAFERRSSMNV